MNNQTSTTRTRNVSTSSIRSTQSVAKEARTVLLDKLCEQICFEKKANKGKVPYGFVATLVKDVKTVCPWITRDHIMYHMRSRAKKAKSMSTAIVLHTVDIAPAAETVAIVSPVTSPETSLIVYKPPSLGGRPVGSTNKKRKTNEMAAIATINEITLEYEKEKKKARGNNTRVVRGMLDDIIMKIKTKNKIPSLNISKSLIHQRLKRNTPVCSTNGMMSPLACIESKIVSVIIQMSRIRQSLTPTQSMRLINDLIDGTPVQEDLVK